MRRLKEEFTEDFNDIFYKKEVSVQTESKSITVITEGKMIANNNVIFIKGDTGDISIYKSQIADIKITRAGYDKAIITTRDNLKITIEVI